ncbi:hypothetical protein AB0D49_02355 [Streptomyces sp. NPDC048290]|uniref:hypothetical protein n=1 Tax=Streptomyces sp. NPDC048290 TaxID=3155811 RepID=UPI00342A14BE
MQRIVAGAMAALIGLSGLGCLSGCTADATPAPAPSERPSGSASRPPADRAALRAAATATANARSVRVEAATTVGSALDLTSKGTLSWADGLTGTLTITYTGGTLADTMRELGTTSMEARYLPDAYYARMGDTFAAKVGGRHWVRYPWGELGRLGGDSGAYVSEQLRGAAPDRSVDFLLAADEVSELGPERVRGARTVRYSATSHVADLDDPELRARLERAGVTVQTVDIWVDQRDLVVKKVEKGRAASGALTQTAYYDGYGTKVAVRPPPAADTQDFQELLASQGAGTGP